jgi:hypothetical protein
VIYWIVDNVKYVQAPPRYDAIYSLESGSGNCQNFSHLSAAILRAAGIPVRIVCGITTKQPYDIRVGNNILTMNMGQGRHSWIEVWFPELGWIPFDPQRTEFFVSNRYIRTEIGFDNDDAVNDGLVRWRKAPGTNATIDFEERIEANIARDTVRFSGSQHHFGPRELLLQPELALKIETVAAKPVVKVPELTIEDIRKMTFSVPMTHGNLVFPEGVNFALTRDAEKAPGKNSGQMKKKFLVETAEYVTGANTYAQLFELKKPLLLEKTGLALQKFGGSGQIWVELYEDDGEAPGKLGARSAPLELDQIPGTPGYRWIDFAFASKKTVLTPDRYWIVLGYSGSPIINWFYSYGKAVGPIDGTKVRKSDKAEWNRSLAFEFNYRVVGLTTE